MCRMIAKTRYLSLVLGWGIRKKWEVGMRELEDGSWEAGKGNRTFSALKLFSLKINF
jgi:hypothetical protein